MTEWNVSYNIITPQEAAHNMTQNRVTNYDRNGTCFDCGATVYPSARHQHNAFHASYIHRSEVKEGFAVSAVKWCDLGNHAFKANSPGSQSIDVMQRGDNGQEERVTMDMCADHALSTAPVSTPAMALESPEDQIQARYNKLMQDRIKTPMNDPDVSPCED